MTSRTDFEALVDALVNVANSFDNRDELAAVLQAYDEVCGERGQLRDALRQDAATCGGVVLPEASHEFHLLVPANTKAHVDKLRARVATEVQNKKEFERDWLQACDQISERDARIAQLGASLGRAEARVSVQGEALYKLREFCEGSPQILGILDGCDGYYEFGKSYEKLRPLLDRATQRSEEPTVVQAPDVDAGDVT
jgi:hypothetical protein